MSEVILIVDDDEASSFIFSKNLKSLGLDCDSVSNGEDAIKYIQKNKPRLILLDIMLSGISGIEVLKVIREQYDKVELPVIMITQMSKEDDVVQALEDGANDYITKPVNVNIAKARIHTQLTMSDLHNKSVHHKEIETLNSIIITYNHEINNPLAVVVGNIRSDISEMDNNNLNRIRKSADRITEIVKKIKNLTEKDVIEKVRYSDTDDMIKLK